MKGMHMYRYSPFVCVDGGCRGSVVAVTILLVSLFHFGTTFLNGIVCINDTRNDILRDGCMIAAY